MVNTSLPLAKERFLETRSNARLQVRHLPIFDKLMLDGGFGFVSFLIGYQRLEFARSASVNDSMASLRKLAMNLG